MPGKPNKWNEENFGAETMETVTATFGEETISPVPYNTFKLGPFTYTTRVHAGEDVHQAFDRASAVVNGIAKRQWAEKKKEFMERINEFREDPSKNGSVFE